MPIDRRTGDQLLVVGTVGLVALTMWGSPESREEREWERTLGVGMERVVGVVAMATGLVHLKTVGDHWQVRGFYTSLVLLFLRSLFPSLGAPGLVELLLHLLLLLLSFLSVLTFPLIRLPPLSGPLPVSTLYFSLRHPDGRRLSAQMWYPTVKGGHTGKEGDQKGQQGQQDQDDQGGNGGNGGNGGKARKIGEEERKRHRGERVALWGPLSLRLVRTLCGRFHMPSFLLDSISLSSLSSSFMSPLSPPDLCPSLPLVLSSHGLFGFKGDRTLFCMDLASHGAVVVGVDHPQDASLTTFEDGTEVECTSDLKEGEDELEVRQEGLRRRISHLSVLLDSLSPRPSSSSSSSSSPDSEGQWEIEGREEAREVVEEVRSRVDTRRVGVMGHSFGGATAVALSLLDPRIVSAVALDPWLWPLSPRLPSLLHDSEDSSSPSSPSSSSSPGSGSPSDPKLSPRVLMLSAELWQYGWKQRPYRLRVERATRKEMESGKEKGTKDTEGTKETVSWIVRGTGHHNFNDMPLVARPWFGHHMGLIGPSDPYEVYSLITSSMVHFLSHSLSFPFLQSPSSFDPSLFLPPHLLALLAPDETFPVPDHAQ